MTDHYSFSKFNYFKVIGKTVIGVNFVDKLLFAIDLEKYNLLLNYKSNLEGLRKENQVFYSTMVKLGIIKSTELDRAFYEDALLKRRLTVFRDPSYRLTINPTLNCNFSCWYCYETHNKKYMSNEVKQRILKLIDNIVSKQDIQYFELDWFGGEPLLCYKNMVQPISEFTKSVCEEKKVFFISGITTNGYLINTEMIDFFKKVNMQSFQITLDGSKDIHDTIRYTHSNKGSYDRIVHNIILLTRELKPQNLSLRINYTSKSFSSIGCIIDSFPKDIRANIKVLLQQVWQDKESKRLTMREIGDLQFKFKEAGFQIEREILHCSTETSCYADNFNQSVINYDGRVFKCTALNFEKTQEDGILTDDGNILWGNSLAHKIIHATFENEYCKECRFLPICYGPCHKKTTYVADGDDFEKYCFKEGIKDTLDYKMTEFEKTGQALAPLLDFRI